MPKAVEVERGAITVLEMPYSEAMMCARLAGTKCRVLVEDGYAVLVNDFGFPASGRYTHGEVGVFHRADGTMYGYEEWRAA